MVSVSVGVKIIYLPEEARGNSVSIGLVKFKLLNSLFFTMLYCRDKLLHLKQWRQITIIQSNSHNLTRYPETIRRTDYITLQYSAEVWPLSSARGHERARPENIRSRPGHGRPYLSRSAHGLALELLS